MHHQFRISKRKCKSLRFFLFTNERKINFFIIFYLRSEMEEYQKTCELLRRFVEAEEVKLKIKELKEQEERKYHESIRNRQINEVNKYLIETCVFMHKTIYLLFAEILIFQRNYL